MEELLQQINNKLELIAVNSQEVLTLEEACRYLKMSRTMLSSEIKKGHLRFKKKGCEYLFKREWLDNWMELAD